MSRRFERELKEGAEAFGVALSEDQVASCILYLAELKKWNRKINLTSIVEDSDIIVKHFIDSFSYRLGFVPDPGMLLLDMGSGAGFPALPLKIALPQVSVDLVESVQKKGTFLRHIIRTLKLTGTQVWDKRIGDLPRDLDQKFDVVTARAFSAMETALGEGARFLKPGGLMVLSRGPEETIGESILEPTGMVMAARIEMVLPLSDHRRALWVFRKKG